MSKHTQHRHHAINRLNELRWHGNTTRNKGLAQREKINQKIDEHLRITTNMATIGENLAAQFLDR